MREKKKRLSVSVCSLAEKNFLQKKRKEKKNELITSKGSIKKTGRLEFSSFFFIFFFHSPAAASTFLNTRKLHAEIIPWKYAKANFCNIFSSSISFSFFLRLYSVPNLSPTSLVFLSLREKKYVSPKLYCHR